MCKKRKYVDEIAAKLALAQCRRAPKGRRQECRVYYCDKCNSWHITSKAYV